MAQLTSHFCSSVKISHFAMSARFQIKAKLSWSAAEAFCAKNKNSWYKIF